MPTLFRDVRPMRAQNSLSNVPVVYNDAKQRIWITWPVESDNGESSQENADDQMETIQKLEKLEVDLREFVGDANYFLDQHDAKENIWTNQPWKIQSEEDGLFDRHDNNVSVSLKTHKDSWFTLFGWRVPPYLNNDPVIPALVPAPPVLDFVSNILPEVERLKIDPYSFNRSLINSILTSYHDPSPTIFPKDTLFLGFKRKYLHIMEGRNWQHILEEEEPMIFDYNDGTGSATFKQIVDRLGILVFDDYYSMASQETRHVSGASFDVTIAIANETSSLQSYTDGETRQQWKVGSRLVFKRPTFVRSSKTNSMFLSQPKLAGQPARVTRTLINELQILSHKPLRSHQNIVHLFGISWDHANIGTIFDASPILVQPCADHGNLDQYMVYIKRKSGLPWSLRLDIVCQILTGLRDLHACRIVHGDIKCLNILVESIEGSDRPRVMLSDFGFSVITLPGQKEVQIVGATERYASPEVFRCLHGKHSKIPITEAFASDIYSFGLTACAIILANSFPAQDLFDMIIESREGGVMPEFFNNSGIAKMTVQQLYLDSKTNSNADAYLLPFVDLLIRTGQAMSNIDHPESLGYWICNTLMWSPSERITNIPVLLTQLESFIGESRPPDVTTDENENPPTYQLGQQSYNSFIFDHQIYVIIINEVSLEMKMDMMFREDFQIKQQIFNDFKTKANILIDSAATAWPAFRLRFGLRHWAKSAYAAYQVFLCYLHGFGIGQDVSSAGKYLAASAGGGYMHAIGISIRFHQEFPEVRLPYWEPDYEALSHIISFSPVVNFDDLILHMQVLDEFEPDKFRQALNHMKASAFSELVPNPKKEELFRGPDIQYQWFAKGSIGLLERLVSQCSPSDLIIGFQRGVFPCGGKNHNGETALYMCCRIGKVDAVLTLLKEVEWFRKQTTIATYDGRLPLHCLYCFEREHVEQVAEALLDNGADINAIDKRGWRTVDYAIAVGREDVVFYLFNHQAPIFQSLALYNVDVTTAKVSVVYGSANILEYCLQSANLTIKVEMLCHLSYENLEMRIQKGTFHNLPILSQSIGKLSDHDFPKVEDKILQAMSQAAQFSNSDILAGIIENILPISGLGVQSVVFMLNTAIIHSHLLDFKAILTIPTEWNIRYGHTILLLIIGLAGPSQFEIAKEFIRHLEYFDLAKDVLNYTTSDMINYSTTSCSPDCKLHYQHDFPPTLFVESIRQGHYNIAKLIAPYLDHNIGLPTALHHILTFPRRKVLEHVEFLMRLGPEHRKYVCYPIYNRNVLQVVAMSSKDYESPQQITSVLETLIEWFIEDMEEDINALDGHCATALFYAADYTCPAAVQVLLNWGADPMLKLQVRPFRLTENATGRPKDIVSRWKIALNVTTYEYCLHQLLIMHMENQDAAYNRPKSQYVHQHLPFGNDQEERMRKLILEKFRTLSALSFTINNVSEIPSEHKLQNGIDSNLEVKGVVPRTTTLHFDQNTDVIETSSVEIWGLYQWGAYTVSLHVGVLDQMTYDERESKIAHHIKRRPKVVKCRAAYDDKYLYLFRIEFEHEGSHEARDEDKDEESDDGVSNDYDSKSNSDKEADRIGICTNETVTISDTDGDKSDFDALIRRIRLTDPESDDEVQARVEDMLQMFHEAIEN